MKEQIEIMARKMCGMNKPCILCELQSPCLMRNCAHLLYAEGYRKASDVAREIFERLYAHIKYDGHTVSVWKNDLIFIAKEFGVDLKKYESEEPK